MQFMGPSDRAMWLLGDKIASSIVAQTAEVPTLPWSGSGVKAERSEDGEIKMSSLSSRGELFRQGCVYNVEEGLEGEVPEDLLGGMYVRGGTNLKCWPPSGKHHAFTGESMLHR